MILFLGGDGTLGGGVPYYATVSTLFDRIRGEAYDHQSQTARSFYFAENPEKRGQNV